MSPEIIASDIKKLHHRNWKHTDTSGLSLILFSSCFIFTFLLLGFFKIIFENYFIREQNVQEEIFVFCIIISLILLGLIPFFQLRQQMLKTLYKDINRDTSYIRENIYQYWVGKINDGVLSTDFSPLVIKENKKTIEIQCNSCRIWIPLGTRIFIGPVTKENLINISTCAIIIDNYIEQSQDM